MKTYYAIYTHPKVGHPEIFTCQAEDDEAAKSKFAGAFPSARLHSVSSSVVHAFCETSRLLNALKAAS